MKNKLLVFLLLSTSLTTLWFLVYINWISPKTNLDHLLSENLGEIGNWILGLFGFPTYLEYSGTNYVVTNFSDLPTYGVWIGTRCNGFKMFGVFSAIILAFPYAHRHKIWFIPFGILTLHLINGIRVATLLYLSAYYPQYLDFNHNITFEIIVYGSLFLLWYLWIKKFVEPSIIKNK